MYLTIVTFSMGAAYFVLQQLFALFFTRRLVRVHAKSVRSVFIIFVLTLFGYAVALQIPDLELGNRVLHAFVGGFVTMLICYLAIRDVDLPFTRFQYFFIGVLTVTSLGVLNEHVEYFLQTYVRVLFYSNPGDTWLDLVSNTVGILVASAVLVPFMSSRKLAHKNDSMHIAESK